MGPLVQLPRWRRPIMLNAGGQPRAESSNQNSPGRFTLVIERAGAGPADRANRPIYRWRHTSGGFAGGGPVLQLVANNFVPRCLTKVANLQPPAVRAFIAPPLSAGSCRHGGDAAPRPGYAQGGTRPPPGQRGCRRPPTVPPHE